MTSYRPPLLSQLLRVSPALSATSPPAVSVQNGYGVPAACLGDFFQVSICRFDCS